MKKRANREGSIYYEQSRGKWCAQHYVNGKPLRKRFDRQQEAAQWLREQQTALAQGTFVEPSCMTLGEWLPYYMENIAALKLKASTYQNEQGLIRKHLLPALGMCRLQDPRLRDHVQAFIRQQAKAGMKASSIRRQKAVLSKALDEAVEQRYLLKNPCSSVTMPAEDARETRHLTAAEVEQWKPCLPQDTTGRALQFLLGTGLRVSELCALRWDDLKGKTLHITHTLTDAGEMTSTKTKAGRRTLQLNAPLLALVEAQRRQQRLDRLASGTLWQEDGFVFANGIGGHLDRHNLNHAFHATLKAAGLPAMSVHALRHTFATLAVERGVNIKSLSVILGHAKVTTTLQMYIHSDVKSETAAMESMSWLSA